MEAEPPPVRSSQALQNLGSNSDAYAHETNARVGRGRPTLTSEAPDAAHPLQSNRGETTAQARGRQREARAEMAVGGGGGGPTTPPPTDSRSGSRGARGGRGRLQARAATTGPPRAGSSSWRIPAGRHSEWSPQWARICFGCAPGDQLKRVLTSLVKLGDALNVVLSFPTVGTTKLETI